MRGIRQRLGSDVLFCHSGCSECLKEERNALMKGLAQNRAYLIESDLYYFLEPDTDFSRLRSACAGVRLLEENEERSHYSPDFEAPFVNNSSTDFEPDAPSPRPCEKPVS